MRGPLRALAIALLGLLAAPPAFAADPAAAPAQTAAQTAAQVEDDSTYLAVPPFPEPDVRLLDAVRLLFESRFVPDADLGPGEISLYRPNLVARFTIPVSERAVLRLSAVGGMGIYDFRSSDALSYQGVSLTGDSLSLYQTQLALQGGFQLNDPGFFMIREGEIWSLIGGAGVSADFEGGSFDRGISGGVRLALGWELQGWLRLAAGAALSTSIWDGGLNVGPFGSFRWNVTDDLTLRNRGLGAQVEYRVTPRLEVFAAGYRSNDEYALDDVTGAPDDLTLRDRQVLAGVGFEWRIWRQLRLNLEGGAVAWRKLSVRSRDLGTISSQSGDPSPYFEVRFEVRP